MTDERDPQVSRRYRELGAEEPPRALDEAILAASRRAVESRPAPLLGPGGRRRWYFPVAAAAVITLAVAVTVQVERQKPDEAVIASAPVQERKEQAQAFKAPVPLDEARPAQKPARAPKAFTPGPPPAAAPAPQSAEAMRDLAKSNQAPAEERARGDAAPAAPPVVAQAAPAPSPEPARREMEASRPQASAAGARAMGQMQSKVESPDALLERIAELRKQGKHEEADKALQEFRKRYPDYRLSDEMKAKVEKK
jgi:hypothetical protein